MCVGMRQGRDEPPLSRGERSRLEEGPPGFDRDRVRDSARGHRGLEPGRRSDWEVRGHRYRDDVMGEGHEAWHGGGTSWERGHSDRQLLSRGR